MIRLRLKRANAMLAERRNLAPWLENDLMWYTCACVREKVKTRQKRNEMEIQRTRQDSTANKYLRFIFQNIIEAKDKQAKIRKKSTHRSPLHPGTLGTAALASR